VDFDATGQLLVIYCACVKNLRKKREYNEEVRYLFLYFKKTYDLLRREVFYTILIEFGIHIKLVWLMKVCLHKNYSKVLVGR
jgi:hypothetical protein